MGHAFRIFRVSDAANERDGGYVERARSTLAAATKVLQDNPSPNTFAGRKTQEPFPTEDDDV